MKLYYASGACSLSPHIVAREAGLAVDMVKVDFATRTTEGGANYMNINPKGYVPALEMENGEVLTEGVAIVQYLADLAPEKNLAPKAGTLERYRLEEWLVFVSSEVHKGFGPLFNKTAPEEVHTAAKERLAKRFAHVDLQLAGKQYLMGDTFTVADAYLFTVSRWAKGFNIDLSVYPNFSAYMERVSVRPAVEEAMQEEGLQ